VRKQRELAGKATALAAEESSTIAIAGQFRAKKPIRVGKIILNYVLMSFIVMFCVRQIKL
jgi:hypothetical protein